METITQTPEQNTKPSAEEFAQEVGKTAFELLAEQLEPVEAQAAGTVQSTQISQGQWTGDPDR